MVFISLIGLCLILLHKGNQKKVCINLNLNSINLLIVNEQHCRPRRDNGRRYDDEDDGRRCDDEDNNDDCRQWDDEDNDDDGWRQYDDNNDSWRCEDDDNYNNGQQRYNNNNDGLRWDDRGGVMTRLTITNLHFNINL